MNVDERLMTATATITWPIEDAYGQLLNPSGVRCFEHSFRPAVSWRHLYVSPSGRIDRVRNMGGSRWTNEPLTVATCRGPDGQYSVRYERFTIGGKSVRVPVATMFFDADDEASMLAFDAVRKRQVTGVSVEFDCVRSRPIVRDGREVLFIACWDLVGLALTDSPGNPMARIFSCDYQPRSRR